MARKQHVVELTVNGELSRMYMSGLISQKVLIYRDIYFDLDIAIKTGCKKMDAIQSTADRYGVSIQTVYRAVKFMEE